MKQQGESNMTTFPCPLLRGEVELTAEREAHIAERHLISCPDTARPWPLPWQTLIW
jgi:hypothetical protein